jgi:UDP:flavonoid glycosyltransferase YjiC (YdhE family)
MAKIVIAAVGTHGDVRPSMGLAIALRDAGHQVLMCAPPNEEKWITSYGFTFFPIGCDMQSMMNSINEYVGHPLKLFNVIKSVMQDMMDNQFTGLSEAAQDCDFMIASGEAFAVPSVAQSKGIPYCYVNLLMQFLESTYYPPTLIPWQTLPKWSNGFFWKISRSVTNMALRKTINEHRQKLGLYPIKDVLRSSFDSMKIIIALDDILFPAPPDLKVDYIQTGQWQVPELIDEDLEPGLVKFLEDGPPPVYIGFGSMGDPKPHETIKIIEETVNSVGVRVIISKGWANLFQNIDSRNVYLADFVPHTKLFPKVAAVVHHGGIGTVFAAARAGVPQVIVPHFLDHYYQGACLYRKKLIPEPISRSKLTSKRLSEDIKIAISDPEILKNNTLIGEQLRKREQVSLRQTIEYIEKLIESKGLEVAVCIES